MTGREDADLRYQLREEYKDSELEDKTKDEEYIPGRKTHKSSKGKTLKTQTNILKAKSKEYKQNLKKIKQ